MLSAVHAGPEVEADLLGGPCACAAAGAIGLTLDMPHGCDPAMYGGAPARLAPVWEGEQVAESPYQRFMQVRARCAAAAVPLLVHICNCSYSAQPPSWGWAMHASQLSDCFARTVRWSHGAHMAVLRQRHLLQSFWAAAGGRHARRHVSKFC